MLQGTASNVGKSWLCTGFCRVFSQDGWRVAPFKSQNMALNSYVTKDGGEIGRAQGIQAEAAGVEAVVDMNPVLLKPKGPMRSQVILRGKPWGDAGAREYREECVPRIVETVEASLHRLRRSYDVVVIEGAGSPAEINLKDRDIANMRVAAMADAPVLLVGDIDRGGVFASFVGTLALLDEEERRRVKGFLINKFRGDRSLLEPGIRWLEERTGLPVLGVIPWSDIAVDAEDSLALPAGKVDGEIDVAVVHFPHVSNFTDFDPLLAEPDVRLRWVRRVEELGDPDVLLLPGTKNTMADLQWLWDTGLGKAAADLARRGRWVVGICGGFQMLGRRLVDPEGVEGAGPGESTGLGLLPTETVFDPRKRTVRAEGCVAGRGEVLVSLAGIPLEGYEIHMGRTHWASWEEMRPFALLTRSGERQPSPDGAVSPDGRVWGTYLHGLFDRPEFRRSWLNRVREDKGLPPRAKAGPDMGAVREESFNRLAELLRACVDWERIYALVGLPGPRRGVGGGISSPSPRGEGRD